MQIAMCASSLSPQHEGGRLHAYVGMFIVTAGMAEEQHTKLPACEVAS